MNYKRVFCLFWC